MTAKTRIKLGMSTLTFAFAEATEIVYLVKMANNLTSVSSSVKSCFMSCIVLFCSAITSLEEERVSIDSFRTFVRLALVWFCLFLFLLVSGKGCGL